MEDKVQASGNFLGSGTVLIHREEDKVSVEQELRARERCDLGGTKFAACQGNLQVRLNGFLALSFLSFFSPLCNLENEVKKTT